MDDLRRLWSEVAEFSAAQATEALDHALGRLGDLIGVERIWWIGSQRPAGAALRPWLGWEPLIVHYMDGTADDLATIRQLAERTRNNQPPRFHALRTQIDRPCHVERPADVMSDAEWYGDWYFNEILKPAGQDGLLVGSYRLSAHRAAHIGMDRALGASSFSERDRDLLGLFLSGVPMLQRELFQSRGLDRDDVALAPRAQQVLKLLLTDLSEKQIAGELGLTVRSTHQYVTAVLRHFNVRGRRGLMSLFLRHGLHQTDS